MDQQAAASILFLDDDPESIKPHVRYLSDQGYSVTVVRTSDEVRAVFKSHQFDIAILDVNLMSSKEIEKTKITQIAHGDPPYVKEEGEGFRVATWLRENYPATGSIILTAEREETQDKITGLDCGADDYVLKNVPSDEFASRVRSLRRRLAPPQAKPFPMGGLILSANKRTLSTRDGRCFDLTVAEQKLLEKLSQAPIRSQSRTDLYEWIFNRVMVSSTDRAVDNVVSRLRSKTRLKLDEELPISTIYGGGYLLKRD